jgi:hypothetical protein
LRGFFQDVFFKLPTLWMMKNSTATQFAGCTRASNIRWPDALQTGEQMNRHIPFGSRRAT